MKEAFLLNLLGITGILTSLGGDQSPLHARFDAKNEYLFPRTCTIVPSGVKNAYRSTTMYYILLGTYFDNIVLELDMLIVAADIDNSIKKKKPLIQSQNNMIDEVAFI